MTKAVALALSVAALLAAGTSAVSAADMIGQSYESDDRDGVKIGYLSCDVGGGVGYVLGSAKELDCVFNPIRRGIASDHYTGVIRKMGVDLGFTTRGKLAWAVFAPTAGYHRGSLSGLYQGITAEATLAAGVGANVLVGGTAGSIQLQTISVTGQLGLNVAATGTSVTLNPAN
ncbi:DUF992 domain-containing protein [Oryzifoliimicrobium ureilyticus]|uniref:DUF992 domain-containing protein n=1 Tax=Oryzifoliimicrobium ureilyticus TaxID=3113724 RepID=UPI0030760557